MGFTIDRDRLSHAELKFKISSPKELTRTIDALDNITIMAYTGIIIPAMESGSPIVLTPNAIERFCLVLE